MNCDHKNNAASEALRSGLVWVVNIEAHISDLQGQIQILIHCRDAAEGQRATAMQRRHKQYGMRSIHNNQIVMMILGVRVTSKN